MIKADISRGSVAVMCDGKGKTLMTELSAIVATVTMQVAEKGVPFELAKKFVQSYIETGFHLAKHRCAVQADNIPTEKEFEKILEALLKDIIEGLHHD